MHFRGAPLIFLLPAAALATHPNAATRQWWTHVEALSNDSMGGRYPGSEGHRRAVDYVVRQFAKNGLMPAGEAGYTQSVPLRVARFQPQRSKAELISAGKTRPLQWLRQIAITSVGRAPEGEFALQFVGSASYAKDLSIRDTILVEFAAPRFVKGTSPVLQSAPEGSAGLIEIDSTSGPEPRQWPIPVTAGMLIRSPAQPPAPAVSPASPVPFGMAFNPEFAKLLFEDSGHSYQELERLAAQGKPLPNFPLHVHVRVSIHFEGESIESDNILAILPGSGAALNDQCVVVSAHLDGWGIGEPWHGDPIYNGTFDDAAYVATLIELAARLHDSVAKPRRCVLFAVFTAEEEGMLGSAYFIQHPTISKDHLVADINLDYLRPIFPLKLLTVLGLSDSTLGEAARTAAESLGIRAVPDSEPDRRLLSCSDQMNFIQAGVPSVAFIFGYEKGSADEKIYRKWYQQRYHRPADDLKQPWNPAAAALFNEFFYRLVAQVANANARASPLTQPIL